MDAETSWRVIEQERRSLAALLEGLTDEQWNSPSLCDGWRVKDVAAHVALAPQAPGPWSMLVEGVRAGGRFHKINHDVSVRHAERPGADLVAELREHAASRRLPKVTNYRNILFDILVHGQDIAIPLGIQREMPKDAARAGIERVWTMGWPFGVKRPLKRFRFTATDVDWAAGGGPEVSGPVEALLLLLTGRPAALQRLSGLGVEELSDLVRR
ncbi:MAG TPA: maleylpyruvate isomerase family mycothiol-dependent enzyme [Mycobacterium sp.]|nr:maleylpyruvate isomerase family mycothiol-dependent enzyme [Mycobacterium sp.]